MTMPRRITHCMQKHPMGCGIACLAMVTGQPYDRIASEFKGRFEDAGIYMTHLTAYLHQRGIATIKYHERQMKKAGHDWPVVVGQYSIAEVFLVPRCRHYIVITSGGVIHDPLELESSQFIEDKYTQKLTTITALVDVEGAAITAKWIP